MNLTYQLTLHANTQKVAKAIILFMSKKIIESDRWINNGYAIRKKGVCRE